MSFFGWGKSDTPKTTPKGARKPVPKKKKTKPAPKEKELTEEQIFASVEDVFFDDPSESNLDPLDDLLRTLPDDATPDDLQKMIATRESQLSVINSRLYAQVINNYDKFVKGMVQIRELGVDLETTVNLCRNGRSMLHKTDRELISAPVNIISNNRKSILYRTITEHLQQIQSIQNTEQELKLCLSEGDFPSAIQYCKRFAQDVEANQQFTSVQALSRDINRYDNLVQQKLDASLLEVTRSFSEINYERLLKAYKMSEKLHRVTKKLQQNFTDSVIAGTQDLLYAHVLASEKNALKAESLRKLSYAELTKKLAEENFMPCLQQTFEYLVELMHSHYQMSEWHLKIELDENKEMREGEDTEVEGYNDIRLGLKRFSKVVWDLMQKCVVSLLKNSALALFKIEPFLEVLDAVSKFIEFGEEFSSENASQLQTCILQESRNYFKQFHKKKLEDLRTMVENEHWEAMPVQAGFAPVDIKEIRYFVQSSEGTKASGGHASSFLQRNFSHHGDVSALASLSSTGNPFSEKQIKRHGEVESDDEDEELKQEFVAEEGVSNEVQNIAKVNNDAAIGTGASVTIVCVNLVRYIGNYLQMMKILQPIASEVFQGVSQLYEYYLYTVFYFFSSKPNTTPTNTGISLATLGQSSSSFNYHSLFQRNNETESAAPVTFIDGINDIKLQKNFAQIHQTFFAATDNEKVEGLQLPLPKISTELDIQSSNSMYGLKHRTVALESLEFLAHCLNSVKVQVLQLLPRNCSEVCNKFYEQYVDIVPRVRDVIMEAISERFVNVSELPQQIEKLKWNINDIDMQHNQYVNTLMEEFRMLSVKLQQVVLQGIVSRPEKDFLLTKCICLAMEQLVEGYSRIKKCSSEGRTQMSLDVQVFVTALKDIAPTIRPVPRQEHVDVYIKAFYSENILEWIVKHQDEYTGKQLLGLAMCTSSNLNRKDSKELFKAVDDICAKKKN